MHGTMQDFPLTLQHVLWRIEKLFPKKEIVTLRETGLHRHTYSDFVVRVKRLANVLTALGIGSGDRVGTLAWNSYRHLELYYAAPCMGAILHTLNPRLFPEQLAFIINDAADKILFVDETLLPALDRIAGQISTVETIVVLSDGGALPAHSLGELRDYETLLATAPTTYTWPTLDEYSAAAMCYTSGTTGNPKGVVYTHRSQFLHAMTGLQTAGLSLSEQDTVLPVVPMFHVNSWGLPFAAGMVGAKLVFPDRWAGDAAALLALCRDEEATVLAGVPTVWLALLRQIEETGATLPQVRTIICGGSAAPPALIAGMARHGLRVLHAWGMTEMSPIGTVAHTRTWHTSEEATTLAATQGPPVPGVEMRIADIATGAELPWDGIAFGEVQVRGPWVASGYYHDADSGKLTTDGWFRTGDVATINPDGYMAIVDRTKDVIKSGGEWISSVELENTLMAHPRVLEAAVIALPHPKWQERPVAFVVLAPDARGQVSTDELRDFLSERVARWWLPDEIRFIESLPKTSVGKFDKKVLRAEAAPITSDIAAR